MGVKLVKNNKIGLIVLILLVLIGITILTNFLSFSNVESLIIKQVKETQIIETQHAATSIQNHVNQVKDELVALSKFPIMKTLDINECSGNMKIIHEDITGKIQSLLRVNRNGDVVECSTEEYSDYLGFNVENKDYFKIPKETNEPFIAGITKQGSNQQIIVSAPLFATKEYTPYPNFVEDFEGILMSIIELDKIYNLYLHQFIVHDKNYFLLLNSNTKETILKSEHLAEYENIKKYLSDSNNKMNTISDLPGFGETIITSYDLIIGSETWSLFIFLPLSNIGTEIESVQQRHLFSLVFVILIIIAVSLFLISLYKSKEQVETKLEETNTTLEKLGINIEFEKNRFNQTDIKLESNNVYLINEEEENNSQELFIGTLNRGFAGLGIVRTDPRQLKEKYNLQKTSFIWLSKEKIKGVPCETNINTLHNLIGEFLKQSKKSVILIDRIDYIISENNFEEAIKMIRAIKDLTATHNSIIIISANPELITESELKAIQAETIDLYGKHLKRNVDLTESEFEMLKFINQRNIINKLASYKDITLEFNITKPTTRAKINKLQSLGLVLVEQKGRFKSLKITSTGRKII